MVIYFSLTKAFAGDDVMKVKRFVCLTTSIVIALLIHNAILKSFVILHYDLRECEWLYDYNDCIFQTMATFSRPTTVSDRFKTHLVRRSLAAEVKK